MKVLGFNSHIDCSTIGVSNHSGNINCNKAVDVSGIWVSLKLYTWIRYDATESLVKKSWKEQKVISKASFTVS